MTAGALHPSFSLTPNHWQIIETQLSFIEIQWKLWKSNWHPLKTNVNHWNFLKPTEKQLKSNLSELPAEGDSWGISYISYLNICVKMFKINRSCGTPLERPNLGIIMIETPFRIINNLFGASHFFEGIKGNQWGPWSPNPFILEAFQN